MANRKTSINKSIKIAEIKDIKELKEIIRAMLATFKKAIKGKSEKAWTEYQWLFGDKTPLAALDMLTGMLLKCDKSVPKESGEEGIAAPAAAEPLPLTPADAVLVEDLLQRARHHAPDAVTATDIP